METVIMLRLGILGLSEGNGHPYSWSAIFNGYDMDVLKECPFPVIPEYLSKQKFPEDAIQEGRVTHIWTQDKKLSHHIAKAAYIEYVVDHYTDMIGQVDAVLLARDDHELHYEMSKPFIEAGLPIYIDKPIAVAKKIAEKILSLERYEGQIFTCSSLSFAKEFTVTKDMMEKLGSLEYVNASIMKSWDKYAIHIIEPVLKIIGHHGDIIHVSKAKWTDKHVVTLTWQSGLITTFSTLGKISCPIKIQLYGQQGYKELIFRDTFNAFKNSLQTFVDIIKGKVSPPNKSFILQVVDIIEKGL